jgi:hypothetical protein
MEEGSLGPHKRHLGAAERIGRDVGSRGEDALGPLRRVLGKIASRSEAVSH